MGLYELMREYAVETGVKGDPSTLTPELGHSLSLFHTALLEAELSHEGEEEKPWVTASPTEIDGSHLSYFVVAFLPFSSVSEKSEMNAVLFDLYSFFKWMDKKGIKHGFSHLNLMDLIKDLCAMQERCLQLSHLLDHESGRILEQHPDIVNTVNDVFSVIKIDNEIVTLKGRRENETVRLRLPEKILPLIKLNDSLELVLGDTSESWVLLEAGQVFPEFPTQKLT
ncbi:MAG: hypothetical protein NPINA01_06650 [Nitrospinaceae bacterium]|nr:MAG: hypothetical protein NPINA01_06650 [Nitrospinaceae bacterium]